METTTKQNELLKDLSKTIERVTAELKESGMDDEYITYHLNQKADILQTYAEDIEKGAKHLNTGFTNWVPSN